jgi:mono/diheme cytochrome c family protein
MMDMYRPRGRCLPAGRNRKEWQMIRYTARCVLLLALAGSVQAFGPGQAPANNPMAGDRGAAGKGEELFGRNCQQCHNSRGKGGKGPQLVKGAWGPGGANSDGQMFELIAHGRAGTQMGGFANSLKEEEIWQIIAFLREEALRVQAADKLAKDDDEIPYY